MQSWFLKITKFWIEKINPKIGISISTVGTTGIVFCLAALYIVANISEEVIERESFSFDKEILLWIHEFSNPVLDTIILKITQLGNPHITVPVTVVSFGLLWWKRYRQEAKIFLINCFGGVILSYGLKLAFSKPRPQLWEQLISETSYSYPSGHALGSMVLYGFLAYLLADRYPKYAKAFYCIAAMLITAIGLSRLYLGVHWPTDVIAGYGIGFLWINFCIIMLNLRKAKSRSI